VAYLLGRNIRYEEDLVDQLFNSSEKRLARVLLLLAHFGKEGVPETVIPKLSQETLARALKASLPVGERRGLPAATKPARADRSGLGARSELPSFDRRWYQSPAVERAKPLRPVCAEFRRLDSIKTTTLFAGMGSANKYPWADPQPANANS
jgi:hypothetical protein